ncbi:MAG: N-6 DNA methylase [Anaerolineae bacterium]|nr:N-6 DNA methylase [Anaerolineae bacterium]
MIKTISRQEVLNIAFARALHADGIAVAPESVIRADGRRRIPDVIVRYRGLRLIIEGEIDDQPDFEDKAYAAACRRLDQGLAPIAVGVIYPSRLRDVPFEELTRAFVFGQMRFTVITLSDRQRRFVRGGLNYLREVLERAYDHLAREDEVTRATEIIDEAVEQFALVVLGQLYARMPNVAEVLEMPYQPKRNLRRRRTTDEAEISASTAEDEAALEAQEQVRSEREHYEGVCHIAGLVVMNALIFHHILSQHDSSVKPLHMLLAESTPTSVFAEHWEHILRTINYYPIFHLARRVLLELPARPDFPELFRRMSRAAERVVEMRAALQHDLMGRVYHRLLSQAKYLGTYYTTIPAAILLLKLALNPKRWDVAWHDLDVVRQLRVADLACGSGTLLMAAADVITGNHVDASAHKGVAPRRAELQKALSEEILYGYDVLASAVHLTASTLALRAPEQTFEKMNLFALPLGGDALKLGSLEFGNTFQIALQQDMFGSAVQVTGSGERTTYQAPLPKLDLCVMNPPFVRSVGGNLLFGSMPEHLRSRMQARLQRMIQQRNLAANSSAGLGAVFAAIAHPYIKEGGRIALVLPKALLSGVAWEKTRQLINQHYRLEYLVVSHDPEGWNFSHSTDLSEVLLVARKITADESGFPEGEQPDLYAIPKPKGNGTPTIFTIRRNPLAKVGYEGLVVINLHRRLRTAMEALVVSWAATASEPPPNLLRDRGAASIEYGDVEMGEIFLVRDEEAAKNWMLPCAFSQNELTISAYSMLSGDLWLPDSPRRTPIALCALSELGELGPDRRNVHNAFEISKRKTSTPAFWGHDSSEVVSMAQQPNCHLKQRIKALPKNKVIPRDRLLPFASQLLLGERMWLNTQRLFAVRVSQPVLSNVWWTFKFNNPHERREKALTLWLNGSLHILMALAHRIETRGAWVQFKKGVLANLPVLDVRLLTEAQLDILVQAYDRLCEQPLRPFPEMEHDPVRAEIDKAISEALGLPSLSGLRLLLGQEPVISLKRL